MTKYDDERISLLMQENKKAINAKTSQSLFKYEKVQAKPNYSLNEQGTVVIGCGAAHDYRGSPFHVCSPCSPLNLPRSPLLHQWTNTPPLPSSLSKPFISIMFASKLTKAVFKGENLNPLFMTNKLNRLKVLWDIKRFQNDPYGPENLYNGTCVDVSGDVLVHTGNDGQIVANKLKNDGNSFEKIKSSSVILGEEERLKFTRIFSVSAGRGDNVGLVGARYRYGATFFNLEEDSEGLPRLNKFYSLPSAKEAVEQTFLPDGKSAVLDSSGLLSILDLNVCSILARGKLNKKSVDVEKWRWGVVKPAYHPRTLLVGDRLNVGIMDLRTKSGDLVEIFSSVKMEELVRGLDSTPPYTYILTDGNMILCDVRNRKRPVDSWRTRLPVGTQGSGLARERIGDEDWLCAWNRWGDTSVMVLDWGHSRCGEWKGDIHMTCTGAGERRPDTVGMPLRLPGWRDAVRRGRALGGSWLDDPVEQRVRVVFTGACLLSGEKGVAVVGVNGVGDLTETRLGFGEEPFRINEDEEEEEKEKEEAWMEVWGEEVVNSSKFTRIDITQRFDREKAVPPEEKILKMPRLIKKGNAGKGLSETEKMPKKKVEYKVAKMPRKLRKRKKEKAGKGLPIVFVDCDLKLYGPDVKKTKKAVHIPHNIAHAKADIRNHARNLKSAAFKLNLSNAYTKRTGEKQLLLLPRSESTKHLPKYKKEKEKDPNELEFIDRCILQILDGETPSGAPGGKEHQTFSEEQETSTLPGVEDPDYTMRAFLDDLGAHSQSQF